MIDAAYAGQAAGTLDATGPLLRAAVDETDDDGLRIAAQHLQCRIQMWSGSPEVARDELLDLVERTEPINAVWAALMLVQAAVVSIAIGEQRVAGAMAARAAELTGTLADADALPLLAAQAVTQAVTGDVDVARALLDRCAPHLPGCDPLSIDQVLVLAALAHACLGEVPIARHWLETAVRGTRAVQAAGLLPFQLSWLTFVCWLDGDWTTARAHGHAAVRLAEETGWTTELPNCLVMLATVEATTGRSDDARHHLERAARLGAERAGGGLYAAHAARIGGLIELGAGRPERAADELGAVAEFALAARMGDPVVFSWAADHTEALIRAGRIAAARQSLLTVEEEAARTRRPTARAVAAQCAGLLAETDEGGRTAFEDALRRHAEATQPFEEARTRLCFGQFLRRHRARAEARTHLDEALVVFRRLGAVDWAALAEAELTATGRRAVRSRVSGATAPLTPQEMQVALAVGDGVTNAEAAARLFLSPRTIEYHLTSIFRKLGISSRAELVRHVAEGSLD